MSNNDYIRRAVSLADGWAVLAENFYCYPSMPSGGFIHFDGMIQVHLDALAAQLVRQVDALGWDTIIWRNGTGIYDRLLEAQTHISGPDRTMNTIKAIVDSGVLK